METSAHAKAAPSPGSFPGLCPFPVPLCLGSLRPREGIQTRNHPCCKALGETGAGEEDLKCKEQGIPASGERFLFQARLGRSRGKASSLHLRGLLAAASCLKGSLSKARMQLLQQAKRQQPSRHSPMTERLSIFAC